jgi:hypothetical protein
MTKRFFSLTILSFALFAFASCSKDSTSPNNDDNTILNKGSITFKGDITGKYAIPDSNYVYTLTDGIENKELETGIHFDMKSGSEEIEVVLYFTGNEIGKHKCTFGTEGYSISVIYYLNNTYESSFSSNSEKSSAYIEITSNSENKIEGKMTGTLFGSYGKTININGSFSVDNNVYRFTN